MSIRKHAQIHFTPTVVADMLNFLKHGVIPVGLSASSARRFQQRCNGFNFYNNTLIFNGKSVVPTDRAEQLIKDAYDQKDTVGKGINLKIYVHKDGTPVNVATYFQVTKIKHPTFNIRI
jgi:hypothetical protein